MTKNAFLDRIIYEAKHDSSTEPTLWTPKHLTVNPMIHFHQAVEVIYIEKGEATMRVDLHEDVTVTAGEFFVVDEAVLHSTLASTDGKFHLMLIPTAELDGFLHLRGNRCFGAYKCPDNRYGSLSALVKEIYGLGLSALSNEKKEYRKILLNALLSGILMCTGAKPKYERASTHLAPIILYIQEHISEPFTIKELAAHFGYTPRSLSTLFGSMSPKNSHLSSTSLKQYIAILRLSNAKQMLDSGATLEEAAEGSGYGCMRSFHRAFATLEHITPGEYAGRQK
ncbi:MAG: helix-turn-helix domain-containing protein [Clostridia bacterium]|nr:helix-turn-helix domain-containing protein [Clostridia bacterium]